MAGIWDDLGRQATPTPETDKNKPVEAQGNIWDEINKKSLTPDVPEKRGALGALKDYSIELGAAALQLPKAGFDFFSPGSEAGANVGKAIDYLESGKSQYLKSEQAQLAKSMASEDLVEQAKGAAQYVMRNPGAAAAQAIGSFIGPGAAIKGGKLVAGALNLGEKAAGRVALGSGMATTGVLAGGDAAGDAYQTVMNSPSLANMPINEREQLATKAAHEASVVPFVLGAVSGAFGAEKALATGTKSILKTAGQEFISEAIEEGGTKLSANIAAKQYAPETSVSSGVVGSAVLGGLLGGGTGLAVGAMAKQPDSLLQGSTNISSGYTAPDSNAINKAIDANSTEIDTNSNLQVQEVKQRQAELEQAQAEAKAQADAVAQQQAQEKAVADQEAAKQLFTQTAQTYGVKPLEVANQFEVAGKRFFSVPQATAFLQEVEKLNEGKSADQKSLIGAALSSGAVKVAQNANNKAINNAAIKFLDSWGFGDAANKVEAADRAETLISSLEGPKALKEADQLNNFYKSITGTDSPAFVSLQQLAAEKPKLTKGASNERLQLQQQGNARVREVPVQGRTTETSGAGVGNVRPSQVQPIGAGSVGAGPLGIETGAVSGEGIPTSTSAGGAVSSRGTERTGQGQRPLISDERVDAINAIEDIAKQAFGTRDYQIIMEFIQSDADMNQSDVARKFNISRQRVNQIVGAAKEGESFNDTIERRAQESWGPRFLLAGRNMGYSQEEIRGLFEVIQKSQDETSLAAAQKAQALSEEGATEEDLQGKETTEGFLENEDERLANMEENIPEDAEGTLNFEGTLGFEDTNKTEKENLGYRVFNPEVSGETGIEGASSTNRAKFSKKELNKMSDEQLQNIAADEETTEERLDDVINEMLRRQEIRVNKGKPNANEKPSAKKKTVGNKPAASEGVREQNAEERQVTKTRQEGETDEEAASKAWNEGIKDFPEAPKFEELAKDQQEDWVSFGPENWTKDDVQTELVKLAKLEAAGVVINKNAGKQQTKNIATPEQNKFIADLDFSETLPDVDVDGNQVNLGVAVTTLDALQNNFPGIARAIDAVSSVHGHLLDAITSVGIVDSYDFGAAIATEIKADGRVVNWLMITKATLETSIPGSQTFTILHETGHLADMAGNGGAYSNHPDLSVRKKGNDFIMQGTVAKELFAFYEKSKEIDAATLFAYPFEDMAAMDAKEFQQEMFAQLWASYYNTVLSEQLKAGAPNAYKFIEEAYNHAEEKRSVVPSTANTARTKAAIIETTFKNRYKGSGVQGSSGLLKQSAQQVTVVRKVKNLKEARQAADKQLDKLPKEVQGPVRYVTDTIENFAKNAVPYAAFTEDLADIASKFIPSVKKYVGLMKERQAIRTRLERQVDDILQSYDKLPNEVKGTGDNSINKFLMDSTREGKWAYNPGWIKNFDETKDIDTDMQARFDALPDEAQELVKRVFAHGQSTLLAMQKSVIENINSEYDALIAAAKTAGNVQEEQDLIKKKANELIEYRRLMRVNSKKPYAPLKRFGDYVVVGKSKDYLANEKIVNDEGADPIKRDEARKKLRDLEKNDTEYFVQFAETVGEAKALARQEANNYAQVEDFEKDTSNNYGGRDIQSTFHRLRNLVEDTKDSNLGDASERAVNRLLADLHLTLLSEQSARQSERRRRGIGGAEKDMMRAFATQGRATASFISSLENTGNIYDVLREMKTETDKGTIGTRAERRKYYNEFMKRHFMGMDYRPSPFMDKALSTTSMWMLLTNPGYYLQNMTQPFMMSLPVIGAKHGYARSWKEMTRAYTDIASVIKKHGLSENSYNKLPEDVRNMVQELVNRGRIDISLEQDLGRWRSTEDSKLAKFGRASELLRGMAQDIETINRVATAVAAYRMEVKTSNPTRAINYADKIIYTTHGDYSGFNAPRITRQGLGRLATQFRKFQLIQISLIARLYNDAFHHEDADTRLIGKKALAYTLGHTAVMGGIMGLPGFAAIAALYGMLFGDEDEPENPELALRRAINDDTIADLLVKGVPAALGVDVSGKLGMGQMLSILPYTDVKFTRKDLPAAGYALLTGPFGGLTLKAADGMNYIGSGDYQKGLEQLLPTGLGNLLKAERYATEGITTKAGDVVMKPEDIGAIDAFMVALGLPTKPITDRNFLNAAKFQYDEFYNEKASEIKREYVRAYKEGDNAGLQEARDDWKNLQESRAKNGYSKQPLSNLLKAPQEQKKRERNVTGGVQFNKSNRGFVKQTSEL